MSPQSVKKVTHPAGVAVVAAAAADLLGQVLGAAGRPPGPALPLTGRPQLPPRTPCRVRDWALGTANSHEHNAF